MGAWGLGPFDNDTACDWGYELDEAAPAERPTFLRKALDRVVGPDSHWRELWEKAGRLDEITAVLAPVRSALADYLSLSRWLSVCQSAETWRTPLCGPDVQSGSR